MGRRLSLKRAVVRSDHKQALIGLDNVNVARLVTAIRRASGKRPETSGYQRLPGIPRGPPLPS
jgi:hypothetical protein